MAGCVMAQRPIWKRSANGLRLLCFGQLQRQALPALRPFAVQFGALFVDFSLVVARYCLHDHDQFCAGHFNGTDRDRSATLINTDQFYCGTLSAIGDG